VVDEMSAEGFEARLKLFLAKAGLRKIPFDSSGLKGCGAENIAALDDTIDLSYLIASSHL
jgi:hypothetical protein